MKFSHDLVVFDLDGTLLDTSEGIYGSVRFAEKSLHLLPIDNSQLKLFVGPPPKQMYMKIYGLSEEVADEATKAHRLYGKENAIFQAVLYDGISDCLAQLKERKKILAVATLKNQEIAETILKNFNIFHFFDLVAGMNNEESKTKAELLKTVIQNLKPQNPVLVGDTDYDLQGARSVNIDFIGVTYGFGFSCEESYNFPVVGRPLDLLGIL